METLLQIPVIMDGYRSMIAGSVKITFETQENTPPELLTRIFKNNKKHGWLCFLPSDKDTPQIAPKDVTEATTGLPVPDFKKGSLSQQLYKQMFHRYMAEFDDENGFDEWRMKEMEKLIDRYRQEAFEMKDGV